MNRAMLSPLVFSLGLVGLSNAALAEGDAATGQNIFKKCARCHSLEPGKKIVGPSLHGVVGRVAGTLEGFKYSKAMKARGETGAVWDEAALDVFLTAPRK